MRTQTDERLVALSREGRDAAFEEIVRRYRPGLVAFAAAYAPPDRAEDVVQESFLSSWRALRRSSGEIRLKPWLYTIVRNRALNARRDSRPEEQLSDDIDGVRTPAEIVLTNEALDRVIAAVGSLPEPQREALVRSAVEGHTHEQIAASIGSTPGAVRQLIYRGRLAVRGGVGLLIPLPLVRALSEVGGAEAVASAVAGGTAAAAAGAGGSSALTKATVVAVAGTLAAGSGVAIKRAADEREGAEAPSRASAAPLDRGSGSNAAPEPAPVGTAQGDSRTGGPQAAASGGSDDDDRSEREGEGGERGPSERSGPGAGEREGPESDSSGPGGPEDFEVEHDADDDSGSGGSGSGSSGSGSGSSGSGSGSSGSGSGSSGSGSGGSGSSGSGSGGSGSESSGSGSGSGSGGSSGSGSSGSGSSGSGSSGSEGSASSGSGSGSDSGESGSGSSGSGSDADGPEAPEDD